MKIVRVDWLDSSMTEGWHGMNFDAQLKPVVSKCVTVGRLLANTKKAVTLAGSWGTHPDQACAVMTIPRCAIRSIVELEQVP